MLNKRYNDSPDEGESMVLHIQENVGNSPLEIQEFVDQLFKNKPRGQIRTRIWKSDMRKLVDKLNNYKQKS